MTKKLYKTLALLSLLVLLIASFSTIYISYRTNYISQRNEIISFTEASRTNYRYTSDFDYFLEKLNLPSDYRLSYFDPEGQILYDSQYANESVAKDLAYGVEDLQNRNTTRYLGLHGSNIYSSIRLPDGYILRLAKSIYTFQDYVKDSLWTLVFIYGLILLALWPISSSLIKYIIFPLAEEDVDFDDLKLKDLPELKGLIFNLRKLRDQMENQVSSLKREQATMTTILENMRQGMIILDDNKEIISISQEALDILCWKADTDRLNIIYLMRDEEFLLDIDRALVEGEVSGLLNMDDKLVRYYLTPVDIEDSRRGVIILFIDETLRIQNETIRREFSSNVSHELKTPLTSISGFAELLTNDMVREEDKAEIYGAIFNEAQRLLSLIEDIMVISKLEEGNMVESQNIDVRKLIDDILASFESHIHDQQIKVSIEGQGTIFSNSNLVWRIYSNIIENAIKYNKPGGSIDISIKENLKDLEVRVSDTGMGIGEDDLNRIFERFYRAERSRNKTTGGTGLGLSIVKHSVNTLNGSVKIDSKINQGTSVKIILPRLDKS